jgi:integrase
MPRLRTALANNSTRTYEHRVTVLDTSSEAALVASFKRFVETRPPIGTALPTRAAALRALMKMDTTLTQEEASNKLASLEGLKSKSMRFALSRPQLAAYYQAVSRIEDVKIKVALCLLPQTGLRPDEMCNLRVEHVRESATGYKLEVHGKSAKPRLVDVRGLGARVLRAYLKRVDSEWLFPGKKGAMNVQCIQHAVSGYTNRGRQYPGISDEIGVSKLTPYVLRHTYATHLLENGVKMQTIATLMGHSSTRTTEEYTHLANTEAGDAIEQLAPKDWNG